MNKNRKVAAIVLSALVGIYTVFFIYYAIYNFKYAGSIVAALVNIGPAFMIYGVLSFILLASGLGGWGKILRKLGRGTEAKNYENAAREGEEKYENVKTKYDKTKTKHKRTTTKHDRTPTHTRKTREERKRERECAINAKLIEYEVEREMKDPFNVRNFITGLVLMIICVGVGAFAFWFSGKDGRAIKSDNYIKTTATVMPVHVKDTEDEYVLRYVYYDENGNGYVFKDSGSFSGVGFKEGKTTTVYYNKYNPEIATTGSNSMGLTVVAVMFIGGGLLVFCLNTFKSQSNVVVPILFGGIFAYFAVGICLSISRAGGLNFIETIMSGPLAFGSVLLGSLGGLFICFGFFNLFREIFYFCLHLKKKADEKRGGYRR